jgi:hypothetical protein
MSLNVTFIAIGIALIVGVVVFGLLAYFTLKE